MRKEEEGVRRDDDLVQKAIDPSTGRDITSEVISQRLVELEELANHLLKMAVHDYKKDPDKKKEIYEKYYWELHQKLGVGSIGPATAAAGPLMYAKMDELATSLNIAEEERIS